MNLDGLNRWPTLGANVGIVVGLALVALQLEQAARYREVEQTNVEVGLKSSLSTAALGDELGGAWARARRNAPEFSEQDAALVQQYLFNQMSIEFLDVIQESRGVGGSIATPGAAQFFVAAYLGNDAALRWWRRSRSIYARALPQFVEAIDAEVERRGPALRTLHLEQARNLLDGALPESVGDPAVGAPSP